MATSLEGFSVTGCRRVWHQGHPFNESNRYEGRGSNSEEEGGKEGMEGGREVVKAKNLAENCTFEKCAFVPS